MVEVSVRENDHLDVLRREIEASHVLDHPVRRDAGVEEEAVNVIPGPYGDQSGESVLGAQRVNPRAGFECLHVDPRYFRAGEQRALGRALVRQQHVRHVVAERRDRDGVHRRERDSFARFSFGGARGATRMSEWGEG